MIQSFDRGFIIPLPGDILGVSTRRSLRGTRLHVDISAETTLSDAFTVALLFEKSSGIPKNRDCAA